MDHFNDLLEVLEFYQQNVLQSSNKKSLLSQKTVNMLMDLTLERLEADSDLTLISAKIDENKQLNVCLPHLFTTSL